MNQEYKLYRISQLLSRFREQVKILNSNGEFSINIHAENILINILNKLYDCNLVNVNYQEGKTYPSIDLRDLDNKIAIQVTSTGNLEKVKSTITKFQENNLFKSFDTLYIFVITEKQPKYNPSKIAEIVGDSFNFTSNDIIDRTDIYKQLNSKNDLGLINDICELLEKQFSDNEAEKDKWEIYSKGIHEYDSYICNLYQYLDIKGFSPKINNTLVKINFDSVFIPLGLKLDHSPLSIDNRNTEEKLYFTLENAINNFDNLVILGDPGSGKTTVLKHLARKICSTRATSSDFDKVVPVFIKGSEFAKYVSKASGHLAEYIIDRLDKKYEYLFAETLEQNQLLLLIDGIDEINVMNLRHEVVNKINSFIAQYPKNKVIVSSRIVGYQETRLNGHFNHLHVLEFEKKQIKKFVKNWYLSIADTSNGEKSLALTRSEELYKSIKENSSVLKLASNPLLVTIIALIHYQGNSLPERRAALYDVATSTFLENWVKQRDSKRTSRFDKDLIIELLAPISFYIHENYTTGLISEGILKAKLTDEYRKINSYANQLQEREDLKEIIDFLREDAGFLFEKGLNENGEAMFGFVHQTFQEYFTAIEFKTRWKESKFKNNLQDFVFNSTWIEVIKLTSSLFKLNEPSRLGRQYATEFVADILNITDSYSEINRPLKVALQILKEETEIEFVLFSKILDNVFELLSEKHVVTDERDREVWYFKRLIKELLGTKTYQAYLIKRIFEELDKTGQYKLVKNLLYILMESSKIIEIRCELIKILESKDKQQLKKIMFDFNVVLPLYDIIFEPSFRSEIIDYVNSDLFIEQYTGHLPTQYTCCFETTKKDIKTYFSEKRTPAIKQKALVERLSSITSIKNEKIRLDYINYHVFSIGFSDEEDMIEYVNEVKKIYPQIKLPKIQNYILKIQKFKTYGLEEYESISHDSTKIFKKKDKPKMYAFVKKDKIDFFKFPFAEKNLKEYFKNYNEFSKFLSIVLPQLQNDEQIQVNTKTELLIFIKYQNAIHWSKSSDVTNILGFALDSLIENKIPNKLILDWIKKQSSHNYLGFDENNFNKTAFIQNVLASNLRIHDQLYLLYNFADKNNYHCLINPVIDSLKDEKSPEVIKFIKKILYEVLA